LDAVFQQYEILIAYLQRPAVLVQIAMFVLTLLVAYGLSIFLLNRLARTGREPLTIISTATFPLLAIAINWVLSSMLDDLGYPTGLLSATMGLLWLFFGYLLVITIVYFFFGEERIRPYHQRIVLPLLILFVMSQLLGNIFDLDLLGNIRLITFGELDITLTRILGFVISIYFVFAISGIIQNILRSFVIPRLSVDAGTSNAILTISRYTILAVGLLMSFSLLGLDLTTLALIGGGLSIGIGFGLQQIVSNFLSGILLLFEQSLRPGDVVDVDGQLGTVQKLSIRSTTVRTLANVDVVIPNERFLTDAVKNYTRSRNLRGTINVGVSYDSDPTEVRRLLKEVVSNHGKVLKNPEPRVFFTDFGASSLDFRVLFWVEHFDDWYATETDLRMMIWRAFQKHKIEIPFPQRDLHLRSMLPIELLSNDADGEET
jgi:small-conductance mechanosensitive channel